jgi:hypothetical protein
MADKDDGADDRRSNVDRRKGEDRRQVIYLTGRAARWR